MPDPSTPSTPAATPMFPALLQKVSGIGASQPGDTPLPTSKFEDQQPDFIQKLINLAGDPLQNASPGSLAASTGLIRKAAPPDAVEELMKLLIGFKPEGSAAETAAKDFLGSRLGGRLIPKAEPITVPGVEGGIQIAREPMLVEKRAAQQEQLQQLAEQMKDKLPEISGRGNRSNFRGSISPDIVRQIRSMQGKPNEIAKQLGLSPNAVGSILRGDMYSWVK